MNPVSRGQALSEMLLILPLMLLLVWSLVGVGRQQQAALELRHGVRSLALAQAQGVDASLLLSGPGKTHALRLDLAVPARLSAVTGLVQVHHELGLMPRGMVGARLGVTVDAPGQPRLHLQRELLTVGMPLLAASAGEVRQRLEQGPLLWRDSGGSSTGLVLSRASVLSRLDAAWQRSAVEVSWLTAWEALWGEQP